MTEISKLKLMINTCNITPKAINPPNNLVFLLSNKIAGMISKIPEITECYYITGSYTLYVKMIAKNHEHMRKILYEQIDSIPGIAKTDSIIELGCAFKRNISL